MATPLRHRLCLALGLPERGLGVYVRLRIPAKIMLG
jgi:hypothetical protein